MRVTPVHSTYVSHARSQYMEIWRQSMNIQLMAKMKLNQHSRHNQVLKVEPAVRIEISQEVKEKYLDKS